MLREEDMNDVSSDAVVGVETLIADVPDTPSRAVIVGYNWTLVEGDEGVGRDRGLGDDVELTFNRRGRILKSRTSLQSLED